MKLVKVDFIKAFSLYEEKALMHRRFKHADILPLLENIRSTGRFAVSEIGKSTEDRSIFRLQYGQGPIKILLWSQMHGDEPTATMALFDLFNFFNGKDDGFDAVRDDIASKVTLYFIPMLNPDGTERFQRRTAMDVDMNRDARATATVEGALLKAQAMLLKPDFAFNLHNQNNYYNIPGTNMPVTISLLAPAYDYARSINETRGDAMRVIVGINKVLQEFVPKAVARYDDEHTPRGFGDNFQKWGARTILIESGAYVGDTEKMLVRKCNFVALLKAFEEIADQSFKQYSVTDYDTIPFNDEKLHDVLLRNLTIEQHGSQIVVDIAIRQIEKTIGSDYYMEGIVEDIGDLQDFYGYQDLDVSGLKFIPAKKYDNILLIEQLDHNLIQDLLHKGIATVHIKDDEAAGKLHQFPINIVSREGFLSEGLPELGSMANFFIGTDENIKYAIINGYVLDLRVSDCNPNYKNRIY
ncbi:M14 family zinc carboxypeptidase [Sphingobacterium sp. UGAL515B_05]|uniref:M14 family zinc carboxypeptidase n=1 Tax=Sphingobacterium sp. UGAL515B_05 TaxID=2986767 RepID=UPI0029530272|nr:M14 family zinc carboxypeptidase [Sphingobacterium sp. UGAL515B_05]WON94859.1 M14 family zinc carboxypeptidase [Sphingobacterium sp. UGAL515B_05]